MGDLCNKGLFRLRMGIPWIDSTSPRGAGAGVVGFPLSAFSARIPELFLAAKCDFQEWFGPPHPASAVGHAPEAGWGDRTTFGSHISAAKKVPHFPPKMQETHSALGRQPLGIVQNCNHLEAMSAG